MHVRMSVVCIYYVGEYNHSFISCRNVKCDGLLAVRRLGAFHPEVLAPQFHVIVLSTLTEVHTYIYLYVNISINKMIIQ